MQLDGFNKSKLINNRIAHSRSVYKGLSIKLLFKFGSLM